MTGIRHNYLSYGGLVAGELGEDALEAPAQRGVHLEALVLGDGLLGDHERELLVLLELEAGERPAGLGVDVPAGQARSEPRWPSRWPVPGRR